MKIDRKKVIDKFAAYTADYDSTNEKVKLKIDHTYRVAALCEQIGRSLELSPSDLDLAWLMGMLHDVGRFEQLRQFDTFEDAKSVDHAALAVKILFEEGQIREYVESSEEDALLKLAIAWHSAFRIPDYLTKREEDFCNLLRDADKIDILRVNATIPLEEIYNVSAKELRKSEVTEEVFQDFLLQKAILRAKKKAPADHVVGHISLVFELVFPISRKIVKKQGYLQSLLGFQSENSDTERKFKTITNVMNEFLKE